MKYKIVKCFLGVACVVCILYGSIRSVYHSAVALASEITASSDQMTALADQGESMEQMENEAETQSRTFEQSEAIINEEVIIETEQTADETAYIEEQTQEQVPTLDEYLSLLTCGGCGRNCLLINPRCHNGSRKASMATAEYNNMYG